MDGLAARCPTVIELTCSEAPPAITYTLCAALAARCLGPVLPPDESTLLGVRSARALATAR
jgi:hypothetical protein